MGNSCLFLFLGIITYSHSILVSAAAQDILAGNLLPTAYVYMAFIVASVPGQYMAMFFLVRRGTIISKFTFVLFITCFGCTLLFLSEIVFKFVGLCVLGLALGMMNVILPEFVSHYGYIAMQEFSTGTGLGFLLWAQLYAGKSKHLLHLFIDYAI